MRNGPLIKKVMCLWKNGVTIGCHWHGNALERCAKHANANGIGMDIACMCVCECKQFR